MRAIIRVIVRCFFNYPLSTFIGDNIGEKYGRFGGLSSSTNVEGCKAH